MALLEFCMSDMAFQSDSSAGGGGGGGDAGGFSRRRFDTHSSMRRILLYTHGFTASLFR